MVVLTLMQCFVVYSTCTSLESLFIKSQFDDVIQVTGGNTSVKRFLKLLKVLFTSPKISNIFMCKLCLFLFCEL